MNGACYRPQYSHSRIILTKITAFMSILDDIFDTYGTTEESMKLQEAINRSRSLFPSPIILLICNTCTKKNIGLNVDCTASILIYTKVKKKRS
jgi:hypothetical protein